MRKNSQLLQHISTRGIYFSWFFKSPCFAMTSAGIFSTVFFGALIFWATLFCAVIATTFSGNSFAAQQASIASLQQNGQVAIKLYQQQNQTIVPNQQLNLIVEVLSAHPFAADFSLPYLDFANTVVIQPSEKAELTTKLVNEELWFIQRKKVNVYPLKSGQFSVPAITAQIKLTIENQGTVVGELNTENYNFEVNLPAALAKTSGIIASSHLEFSLAVEQKESSTNEAIEGNQKKQKASTYQLGDAITFNYSIKADNSHVIMLNKLNFAEIEGTQIYRKPSNEKDEFDRFEKFNTAILSQSVTYIFQQAGEFIIPAQQVLWWDTVNNQLKEEFIEAQVFQVGEALNSSEPTQSIDKGSVSLVNSLDERSLIKALIALVLLSFFLAIIRQFVKHKSAIMAEFHQVNQTAQKQLTKHYRKQVAEQDYKKAISSLYQLSKISANEVAALGKSLAPTDSSRLAALQQLAFNAANKASKSISFTAQDGDELLKALLHKKRLSSKRQPFSFSFKLNPEK